MTSFMKLPDSSAIFGGWRVVCNGELENIVAHVMTEVLADAVLDNLLSQTPYQGTGIYTAGFEYGDRDTEEET